MAEGVMWLNNLSGGMNQLTPSLASPTEAYALVNISQIQLGDWSHRLGSKIYLNSVDSSNQVRGLGQYEKQNGTNYLHMVCNGNVYVNGVSSWTQLEAGSFGANSNVNMVNFIGRNYMAGSLSGEYLRYYTETGAKTLVSGSIEGQYLAANGPYMMISGGTTNPLRSYYSNVALDTFTTTTDYVNTVQPPTGLASFGNGRPFVIFTANTYTTFDAANNYANEVDGFGCVSHRSIQNVKGSLIYMDNDGIYELTPTTAYPNDISMPIKNTLTGNAIFTQINANNYSIVASGNIENRYYLAINNLKAVVMGQTLNSAILEYDSSQKNWKIHTFTTNNIGAVFAQFLNSSGNLLYGGSTSDGTVYQMEAAGIYTDDNKSGVAQTVTSTIRTIHFQFIYRGRQNRPNMSSIVKKTIEDLHFMYSATSPITVKYSLDSSSTYTTLPVTLPVTDVTKVWDHNYLSLGQECKEISLEISCTGNFIIYGVGIGLTMSEGLGIRGL